MKLDASSSCGRRGIGRCILHCQQSSLATHRHGGQRASVQLQRHSIKGTAWHRSHRRRRRVCIISRGKQWRSVSCHVWTLGLGRFVCMARMTWHLALLHCVRRAHFLSHQMHTGVVMSHSSNALFTILLDF